MPDAFTLVLTWLAARELSTTQVRQRLARRQFEPHQIEEAIERLSRSGSLDDRRVARAAARIEVTIRHRGRHRALQRLQRLGISGDVARAAVAEVFAEVDEAKLLEVAFERKLRHRSLNSLNRQARARLVRSLTSQGFAAEAVFARLRARGSADDDEPG